MLKTPELRRAGEADRAALGTFLDTAFGVRSGWFFDRYPHLFTPGMIGSHLMAVRQQTIIGCVGCDPFAAELHGQPLRLAGIGQVACAAEARGGGVMSQLLDESLRTTDADLFWLAGDRQRYERYGFAPGGLDIVGTTWDRYTRAYEATPGPPIRALDLVADAGLIAQAMARSPLRLRLDEASTRLSIRGAGITGWTDGVSVLVLNGEGKRVWAAFGEEPALLRLIAHQVARLQAVHPDDCAVTILADPENALLVGLIRACAGTCLRQPTAMFRVGRLLPLLRAWAASHVPPPGARLRSVVLDGGPSGRVRLAVEHETWQLTDSVDPPDLALSVSALSHLVFGILPWSAWTIPADSVLRYLLPIQVSIPHYHGV